MLDDAILTTLRAHGPLGVPRITARVAAVARQHAPASHPSDVVLFRLQALRVRGEAQHVPHVGWSARAPAT